MQHTIGGRYFDVHVAGTFAAQEVWRGKIRAHATIRRLCVRISYLSGMKPIVGVYRPVNDII